MERCYGRDPALSVRMAGALALLGLFYLPIFLWIAFLVGSLTSIPLGIVTALAAVVIVPLTPLLSERLLLQAVGARVLEVDEHGPLRVRVERVCALADLQVPRIAVVEADAPNAFSAGRAPRNAVLVVTRGLLDRLEDRELDGVLAHELAHIANRDAFVMTFVSAPALLARRAVWGIARLPFRIANPLGKLAVGLFTLYLIPVLLTGWLVCALATLLVMTISRYREYAADRGAALITGEPESVMSALQAVSGSRGLIPPDDLRTVSAFLFVPAGRRGGSFEVDPQRMFPTHPPVEKRLIRLSALARKMARPVALDVEPASVRERPRGENPHAFASFSLALLVWALLAAAWLAEPLQHGFPVWIPLMASLALMLGVVLGLQGAGRASAGAGGMPYAVVGLTLLLGPWVLAVVAMLGFGLLTLVGVV